MVTASSVLRLGWYTHQEAARRHLVPVPPSSPRSVFLGERTGARWSAYTTRGVIWYKSDARAFIFSVDELHVYTPSEYSSRCSYYRPGRNQCSWFYRINSMHFNITFNMLSGSKAQTILELLAFAFSSLIDWHVWSSVSYYITLLLSSAFWSCQKIIHSLKCYTFSFL